MEIPPRELPAEEKADIRCEPLSLEAQSIWHKEADIISERYASWCLDVCTFYNFVSLYPSGY